MNMTHSQVMKALEDGRIVKFKPKGWADEEDKNDYCVWKIFYIDGEKFFLSRNFNDGQWESPDVRKTIWLDFEETYEICES